MENFGKLTTVLLFMTLAPIINGFVFVKLWFWFIVPTFQMNELRIVEAIGIMMLIGFVRHEKDQKESNTDFWKDFLESIIYVILIALSGLGLGWLVNQFM